MENEGEKKRPTRKEAQRRWHGRAARHGHPVSNRWAIFFFIYMAAARSVPLGTVTSVLAQSWHKCAHRHGRPVPIHWPSFFFKIKTKQPQLSKLVLHKIHEYTQRKSRLFKWRWNIEGKTLHIPLTRQLKKMFQPMPIDFENVVISGIPNLHGSMRERSNYHKRTGPPRP